MAKVNELLERINRYHNGLKAKDLNPELLDTREPLDDSPIESDSEKAVKNMIIQRGEKVEDAPKEPSDEEKDYFKRLKEFMVKRKEYRDGK